MGMTLQYDEHILAGKCSVCGQVRVIDKFCPHCMELKLKELEKRIEALEQEPKTGHWIELPKAFDTNENPCKCSACGHILSFMHSYPKSNYCPNCGAKMESANEV